MEHPPTFTILQPEGPKSGGGESILFNNYKSNVFNLNSCKYILYNYVCHMFVFFLYLSVCFLYSHGCNVFTYIYIYIILFSLYTCFSLCCSTSM